VICRWCIMATSKNSVSHTFNLKKTQKPVFFKSKAVQQRVFRRAIMGVGVGLSRAMVRKHLIILRNL